MSVLEHIAQKEAESFVAQSAIWRTDMGALDPALGGTLGGRRRRALWGSAARPQVPITSGAGLARQMLF
jgi:hypothetical protein